MADAFDKLKSSLNRGITTISVKTSSSLEKTKLRTHIESLNNEIQKLYSEIGKTAYDKWANGDPDCAALEQLFQQVQGNQQTIAELTEELNSIDARDNQILGTKTEKAPEPQGITCPNCGAKYETPVKFCRNCGSKMQD